MGGMENIRRNVIESMETCDKINSGRGSVRIQVCENCKALNIIDKGKRIGNGGK
jgi:hypothetical protein